MVVLLAVALLGHLLPLQWMRRRSIGCSLLCNTAVADLTWLLSMGLWQNVGHMVDNNLDVLAPTLFVYILFPLPGEVLVAILNAIFNSHGGDGGGGSGGGGIFRGDGGSSGDGSTPGHW